MSSSFPFPGRRRRSWVSYIHVGCLYGHIVYVVYRCPVVGGVAMYHLAWQHRIALA